MALEYISPDADLGTAMTHRVDQQYATARRALDESVADAAELLAARGPAVAAALIGVEHVGRTGGDVHMLAGALGLALVELARREAHSRDSPA